MTTISKLLRESADVALPVLQGITDEQLSAVTPCAEFRVGDLVNHLFQVVVNFQGLARREAADFSGTPDVLGTDWRARFAAETDQLITAWSAESALEGVSPGMGLPQPTVGRMALLDLTLHPWDLAVATGQPYAPSPAAVEELLVMVDEMGPMAREWKVFGEPVPTAPDADSFTRLLGKTGREPGWQRAG
ncbi:TIGR03086 family metal-binding protein [Catellatospora chokoriensis]|uniref:TIGR03086 family protein n=1 Tax=Catellatospora chokoriensis TaxID=310353 RepID=A0A8J3K5M4_9ACTN|nr:TIGR03086 family metal-binding protein [Catellatospora chokoriensis]GIF91140.1 TIGR03086 family protein [Catellatospora chokoriensis]